MTFVLCVDTVAKLDVQTLLYDPQDYDEVKGPVSPHESYKGGHASASANTNAHRSAPACGRFDDA